MANAKLTSISLERFKSYSSKVKIPLELLNIIIGRNNSGKSSVIQALLLLKQTLEFPRLDVSLRLEGYIYALSLRELTYGWPDSLPEVAGPSFTIEWTSTININNTIKNLGNPDLLTLSEKGKLPWLIDFYNTGQDELKSQNSIELNYAESQGKITLKSVILSSTINFNNNDYLLSFSFTRDSDGEMTCYFEGQSAKQLNVSLEHFIPYISIDKRNVGPRDRGRSWANAFSLLFGESLEDLKNLIKNFAFLSSSRGHAPSLYSPSTEPIDNIGISGEYAAQLLQSHKSDTVHYHLPNHKSPSDLPTFRQKNLVDAVNEVLNEIGVDGEVSIDEIKNVGFRLLFGKASLQHVGRGLSYLIPLIQLGLISDPIRFQKKPEINLSNYTDFTQSVCAFEEPEAHLHPRIQGRLAQWFVALAMGHRQVIIETHSDHLVRHLRSLTATSQSESKMEKWLLENVNIISTEQNDGISKLTSTKLTKTGGLENWPSEFMDESTETEQIIYLASFEKQDEEPEKSDITYTHHNMEEK